MLGAAARCFGLPRSEVLTVLRRILPASHQDLFFWFLAPSVFDLLPSEGEGQLWNTRATLASKKMEGERLQRRKPTPNRTSVCCNSMESRRLVAGTCLRWDRDHPARFPPCISQPCSASRSKICFFHPFRPAPGFLPSRPSTAGDELSPPVLGFWQTLRVVPRGGRCL